MNWIVEIPLIISHFANRIFPYFPPISSVNALVFLYLPLTPHLSLTQMSTFIFLHSLQVYEKFFLSSPTLVKFFLFDFRSCRIWIEFNALRMGVSVGCENWIWMRSFFFCAETLKGHWLMQSKHKKLWEIDINFIFLRAYVKLWCSKMYTFPHRPFQKLSHMNCKWKFNFEILWSDIHKRERWEFLLKELLFKWPSFSTWTAVFEYKILRHQELKDRKSH